MMNKENAYKVITDALELCTVEDAHHMAVVVLVDAEKETVKVYGLNIGESEVPLLLVEAAGEVGRRFLEEKNRTLQ
jgi:hypothetical protein